MPIYEYSCGECGKEFEELVMSSDETICCPECKSEHVERLMSAASFKSNGNFSSNAGPSCSGCSSSSCSSCH